MNWLKRAMLLLQSTKILWVIKIFEPVNSTVGAQKEGKAQNIRGGLCIELIFQFVRFFIFFDISDKLWAQCVTII